MIVDFKMTPQTGLAYPGGVYPSDRQSFVQQRPEEEPVSRTYQYRKVMKPMLERKRRARINRCLDDLKELMVSALQAEGENVAKLEKADILELTVRHLHTLRSQGRLTVGAEGSYAERFRAGFAHCATEVSQFITSSSSKYQGSAEAQAGAKLLHHLSSCVRRLETAPYPRPESDRVNHQHLNGRRHSVEERGKVHSQQTGAGLRCYAPPSPPASPAPSSGEGVSPAHMWRPW